MSTGALSVVDLGRMAYAEAWDVQRSHHEMVLGRREIAGSPVGDVLLVEHDPVITIGRRPGSAEHLLGTTEVLAREGVELHRTDRGGDITYHGPGQLVAYPILDLNRLKLGLHAYMRLLEQVAIDVCAGFGVQTQRDAGATGVWTMDGAKICAMGIRVRRWVSMHGLALNVTTNLDHFGLIVPCGLAGRPVTSLQRELGDACPPMAAVKEAVVSALGEQIEAVSRG
jgi:lipoyl(octanoyl) transferase